MRRRREGGKYLYYTKDLMRIIGEVVEYSLGIITRADAVETVIKM